MRNALFVKQLPLLRTTRGRLSLGRRHLIGKGFFGVGLLAGAVASFGRYVELKETVKVDAVAGGEEVLLLEVVASLPLNCITQMIPTCSSVTADSPTSFPSIKSTISTPRLVCLINAPCFTPAYPHSYPRRRALSLYRSHRDYPGKNPPNHHPHSTLLP
jgi:hypothetical protein